MRRSVSSAMHSDQRHCFLMLRNCFYSSIRDISVWILYEKIICILLDFSLTEKAATLIFISGRGSAISSAKEGKSGFNYNLVKS